MENKAIVPPRSVSVEEVQDLRQSLNSLGPDPINTVLHDQQHIALLQSWVSNPDCFISQEACFIAEEAAKFFV